MAYIKKRAKALKLRKRGMSYSQIKEEIEVSKSTLSLWLRDYPLPKERIRELRDWNEKRIEKFKETMKLKREGRRKRVYLAEKRRLVPLTDGELYIAGLMLYWGEGAKTGSAQLSLSNTDPQVLRFYIRWLNDALGIKVSDIRAKLHLYKDMDISREIDYWVEELSLPGSCFKDPYIKKTDSGRITYRTRGHGTCNVIVYGRDHFEKVMMGIQAISGEFIGLG
jgi:hypothetical protein